MDTQKETQEKTCLDYIPHNSTLPEELYEELLCADFSVQDVLIGSLSSPEQLEANLRERFYYVPAKYVSHSKIADLKRVALFQLAHNEPSGIRYSAKIEEYKLVKRKDIPIKSRRSNGEEDYYFFSVGEWKRTKNPIEAGGEIINEPRFTNSFLLDNCRSVYELFSVTSKEEFILLLSMKKMLFDVYLYGDCKAFSLREGRTLEVNNNLFEIYPTVGKPIAKYALSDFKEKPRYIFEALKRFLH